MKKLALLIVGIAIVAVSCTKVEIQDVNTTVNKNMLVDSVMDGNKIPPYTGVTTEMVENYVNKMHIDLLGREPDDTEMDNATTVLIAAGLDMDSRDFVVSGLLETDEYYRRYHEIMSDRMLNGVDTTTINYEIAVNSYVVTLLLAQGDTLGSKVVEYELNRLINLSTALDDLKNGNINLNEYFEALLDNPIYDEINMGTENFVNSCFENLFNRYPSEKEAENAIKMVDGQPGIIFSTDGANKGDFMEIVTTVDEFYQGLIYATYLNLLLRNPVNAEIDEFIGSVKSEKSIANLQKELLKSEEYAGF